MIFLESGRVKDVKALRAHVPRGSLKIFDDMATKRRVNVTHFRVHVARVNRNRHPDDRDTRLHPLVKPRD